MSVTYSEFGPHLMMDCRQCDLEKISDLSYVFNFLNDLPEKIGMTKIIQPYVFPYSGLVPEDKGITGMVVIAESHLSFHSFVEKDYFFFDMFSCKPFDVEVVRQMVMDAFGVGDAEVHYASRGRYFPREEGTTAMTAGFSPMRMPAPHVASQVAAARGADMVTV